MLWRNKSKMMVSDSLKVRIFREGISMEVTFESAPEWWGDSHVDYLGGDSKCKSPEMGVNWCDSGRQRCKDGGQAWPQRSCWPWSAAGRCKCRCLEVFSEAFQISYSLVSLTIVKSYVFRLHFNVCLCSDIQ